MKKYFLNNGSSAEGNILDIGSRTTSEEPPYIRKTPGAYISSICLSSVADKFLAKGTMEAFRQTIGLDPPHLNGMFPAIEEEDGQRDISRDRCRNPVSEPRCTRDSNGQRWSTMEKGLLRNELNRPFSGKKNISLTLNGDRHMIGSPDVSETHSIASQRQKNVFSNRALSRDVDFQFCENTKTPFPQATLGGRENTAASSLPTLTEKNTSNLTTEKNDDNKKSRPKYRSSRPPLLPPCRVCGDRASGFHYGVNTCEACKGFFRRSINKSEPYVCAVTGQCKMAAGKRTACSACRFKRCLEVGMSKNAIKTGRYTHELRSKNILEVKQLQKQNSGDILDQPYNDNAHASSSPEMNSEDSHETTDPLKVRLLEETSRSFVEAQTMLYEFLDDYYNDELILQRQINVYNRFLRERESRDNRQADNTEETNDEQSEINTHSEVHPGSQNVSGIKRLGEKVNISTNAHSAKRVKTNFDLRNGEPNSLKCDLTNYYLHLEQNLERKGHCLQNDSGSAANACNNSDAHVPKLGRNAHSIKDNAYIIPETSYNDKHRISGFEDQLPTRNGNTGQLPTRNGNAGQLPTRNGCADQLPERNGCADQLAARNGFADQLPMHNGCSDQLQTASHLTERNGFADNINERNGFANHMTECKGFGPHLTKSNGFADDFTERNGFADHITERNGFADHMAQRNGFSDHTTQSNGFADHITQSNGFTDHIKLSNDFADHITEVNGFADHQTKRNGFADHQTESNGFADHQTERNGFADHQTKRNHVHEAEENTTKRDVHDSIADPSEETKANVLAQIITDMERGVQGMLSFAKCLPGFSGLPKEDQVSLMKCARFDIWYIGHIRCFNTELLVGACEWQFHAEELEQVWGKELIDVAFRLARLGQALNLTKEETASLRAVSLSFPDRCYPLTDRAGVESMHSDMLDVFRYVSGKRHKDFNHWFMKVINFLCVMREFGILFEKVSSCLKLDWSVLKNNPLLLEVFLS